MLFAKNCTVIDLINRKACLDILKGSVLYSKSADETNESEISLKKIPKVTFGNQVLDDKMASSILETLAKK